MAVVAIQIEVGAVAEATRQQTNQTLQLQVLAKPHQNSQEPHSLPLHTIELLARFVAAKITHP